MLTNSGFSIASGGALVLSIVFVVSSAYVSFERKKALNQTQRFVFSADTSTHFDHQQNLESTIDFHIFGIVPVIKKPESKPKIIDAPKTNLNITLTGIIASEEAGQNFAMVEVKRGTTSIAKIGDSLGDTGVTLTAVSNDHIIISNAGKAEKIIMERPDLIITPLDLTGLDVNTKELGIDKSSNFNLEEFEALVEVNPEDVDISQYLPEKSNTPELPSDDQPSNKTLDRQQLTDQIEQEHEEELRMQQAEQQSKP